jgi:hypothetical protein
LVHDFSNLFALMEQTARQEVLRSSRENRMIVYGELERTEQVDEAKRAAKDALRRATQMPSGIERHAALVSAFIRMAELVQGIADAEFRENGCDVRTPLQKAGAALLLRAASLIDCSWRTGGKAEFEIDELLRLLNEIKHEGPIRLRLAEGYAHYALYPETYLAAARHSGLGPNTCVIGIRSIGLGLGALVAAALGAPPAISIRPIGHPFEREIKAEPDLIAEWLTDAAAHFAVVDEGPGLSGSSFASVARWLQQQGVSLERIHFFPSHGGKPGSSAKPQTLAIWNSVRCHAASDYDILDSSAGLPSWIEPVTGPLHEELQDVTSTATDHRFARRKFLARSRSGTWLVKFAGIGPVGERKHGDASMLAKAGFGPQIAGLCNGFLVQQWARGTSLDQTLHDRAEFLRLLGIYLGFRARNLGPAGPGASLEALRDMAIHNAREALGDEVASSLASQLAELPALEAFVRRVRTDNRLHAWEWMATDRGFLKLDAVDHCEGHDLIGCQDIAWDVAGAAVEFDLHDDELSQLCADVETVSRFPVRRSLADALVPCYLAFQLGLWSTATPLNEAAASLVDRYSKRLCDLAFGTIARPTHPPGIAGESLVRRAGV